MPHCWIALGYGGNGTTYAQNQTLRIREITGIPQVLAIFAGTKRQILSTSIAADVIAGAIRGRPTSTFSICQDSA
jgi:hypothetical protein